MFGWSSKSNSQSSGGHSRLQHISSFLNDPTLKNSTRKVSKDDSTYDTVFQTKDSNALIVRVFIPQGDRTTICKAPAMSLVGIKATHPWLDDRMRVVGYGPISSDAEFRNSRLLLAQVVNAVVQHFQLNPPDNVLIVDASLKKLQSSLSGGPGRADSSGGSGGHSNGPVDSTSLSDVSGGRYQNGGSSRAQFSSSNAAASSRQLNPMSVHFSEVIRIDSKDRRQNETKLANLGIPSAPTSFPEFNSMNNGEMNNLLQNPNDLIPVLEQTPMVIQTEQLKSSILAANVINASSNLSKEGSVQALRDDVEGLQSKLRDKVETFNQLKERQLKLCKPIEKDYVMNKMKKAKKKSYNESEVIASDWLASGSDVNEFIASFLQTRTLHHVRSAKLERIENS